jgi:hypothetical protein
VREWAFEDDLFKERVRQMQYAKVFPIMHIVNEEGTML